MSKKQKQVQRQHRVRVRIKAVGNNPRLSVFRSNKYVYAQIIDDKTGKTIVAVTQKNVEKAGEKITNIEQAKRVGQEIAKVALQKKIKEVIFDKGSYAYHGRIKALAEGAREGGLVF
ncbi:MAG: 50S ribosomal protein L18 [Candidatus Levybacteria bacterium]|nr:50S ribosomal protein L18 [Candidatus Levybacteria bacterium]